LTHLTLLLSPSRLRSLSVPSTHMRTITHSRLHVRVHMRVPAIGVHGQQEDACGQRRQDCEAKG